MLEVDIDWDEDTEDRVEELTKITDDHEWDCQCDNCTELDRLVFQAFNDEGA